MRLTIPTVFFALAAILLPLPAALSQETGLSQEERAKLDTFEGVSIDKADKVFAAKDWPRDLPPLMEPVSINRVALPMAHPCPLAEA
jgi:hypothetical protein